MRGLRLTAVITYTFSRVSVFGFSPINQYSSSNSKQSGKFSTVGSFFYPVVNICLAHSKHLPHSTATDPGVVHFDCQLSGFFGILSRFRGYGISCAALLTHTALRPRSVISHFHLVLYFSAFWTLFSCFYFAFSHIFNFTLIFVFCPLPGKRSFKSLFKILPGRFLQRHIDITGVLCYNRLNKSAFAGG